MNVSYLLFAGIVFAVCWYQTRRNENITQRERILAVSAVAVATYVGLVVVNGSG
jgi:hypothetical protein